MHPSSFIIQPASAPLSPQTPSHPVPVPPPGSTRPAPLKSNFLAERIILLCLLLVARDCLAQLNGGIEDVLRANPFVAEVIEASGGSMSFKLALRATDGSTRSMQQVGGRDAALIGKAVSHLKAGQTYTFPKCLLEHLEPDEADQLRRTPPERAPLPETSQLLFGTLPVENAGIELFAHRPLLRGRVLDRVIGEERYFVFIETSDGARCDATGDFTKPDTRRIVEHLAPGREYDFPTVLSHALMSEQERAQASRLRAPKLEPLRAYVGEWRGRLDASADAVVTMKCAWLDDGSGLWRAVTLDPKNGDPPHHDIAIIRYDEARGRFRVESTASGVPPLDSEWDEAARRFTFDLPAADGRVERQTIATFTTADRITWKTRSRADGGIMLPTSSGSYERVVAPPAANADQNGKWTARDVSDQPSVVDLEKQQPFLAWIIGKRQNTKVVSVMLAPMGRSFIELTWPLTAGSDTLPPLFTKLQVGDVREFPDALLHPDRATATAPSNAELRELEPLVGDWDTVETEDPTKTGRIHCFWSSDGTGLWSVFRNTDKPKLPGSGVLLPGRTFRGGSRFYFYDDTAKRLRVRSAPGEPGGEAQVTWDREQRVLTSVFPTDVPKPGNKITATQAVRADGLIEWRSLFTDKDGKVEMDRTRRVTRVKRE